MTKLTLNVPHLLLALIASSAVAFAQPATAPSGHWEGAIQTPGQELKIEIDLDGSGDKWKGTINVPVQGLKGFPLSAISVQDDAVTFAMKGVPGDPLFKGAVSKDAKTLSGTFSQGGGSVPFALTRTGRSEVRAATKKYRGRQRSRGRLGGNAGCGWNTVASHGEAVESGRWHSGGNAHQPRPEWGRNTDRSGRADELAPDVARPFRRWTLRGRFQGRRVDW